MWLKACLRNTEPSGGTMRNALFVLGLLTATMAHAEPTIEELLDATDDIQRGNSSRAVIEMHVKTSR